MSTLVVHQPPCVQSQQRRNARAWMPRPRAAQVEGVQGHFASVLAADGGKVNVKLARPPDFESTFVEFVGTVDAPNQITELDRTSFGNTFGAPLLAHVLRYFP